MLQRVRAPADEYLVDIDLEVPELPPEAEARLSALIAEQQARRVEEDDAARAKRSLWLSHHWPDEYERCAVVGGRHVCRRCLVLYPIALVVMALSLAGFAPWPEAYDVWFIWLLCVPATLDFMAEKLLGVDYSARRQIVVTALVALAFGPLHNITTKSLVIEREPEKPSRTVYLVVFQSRTMLWPTILIRS